MQEIDNLRRRVRELESLLNQPHSSHNPTESSHEREFQVASINPCFMQEEEGGRRVGFTEDVCFTREGPTSDGAQPTVMIPCGERETVYVDPDGCLGKGAECSGAAEEMEQQ